MSIVSCRGLTRDYPQGSLVVQALRGVAEGRYDAAVLDAASAAFVTRRHGIAGLRAAGSICFDYALSLAAHRNFKRPRPASLPRGPRSRAS